MLLLAVEVRVNVLVCCCCIFIILCRHLLSVQIGGWLIGKLKYKVYIIPMYCRASEEESCLPETANISAASSSDFSVTTHQRIGIYGGLVGMSGVLIISRAILCYLLCFAAARSLHSKMFGSILRAPVLFYDTNPVGK